MTSEPKHGRKLWLSLPGVGLAATGVVGCAVGFVGGRDASGDAATLWGMLAGVGFATAFVGLIKIWIDSQIDMEAKDPGGAIKRERLQAQRNWMLWVFPVATVVLLFWSLEAMDNIVEGRADFSDYARVALPAMYGWVVTMIAMGWDGNSRKNRRFLEDELTVVLRARALNLAFLVLMGGATVALVLGLVRPELGTAALPFVIALGGVSAGVRFAWLDRQAGRDDG